MKIWIDLTDFLSWKGNLTGIQRIQYNMSLHFIDKRKDEVKFFVYDADRRVFCDINFDPQEIVKSGIVSVQNEVIVDESRSALSLVGRIPMGIRRRVKGLSYFRTYRATTLDSHSEPTQLFGRDDVVLIMGGIWVGNFIHDLELLKKSQGFTLVHFAFDMIPSFYPGYVVDWLPEAFTAYKKKVFTIADGIVAISKSTASDVEKFMKMHGIISKPKIKVVRIGEGIDTKLSQSFDQIDGLNVPFILFVSTVEGRKNHTSLFYVLKEAKARGIKLPKIVIAGRNGWLTDDIRYIMQHDIDAKDGVMLLNNVNDEQLHWLYQNCLFTVFPSFYEGWGMPVAESLAYGKLCLASNTSSLPEIAGDIIDYYSPYDTGAFLDIIAKYLEPETLRKKEAEIKRRYQPTSWSDMYEPLSSFIDIVHKKE